jgi:hypothetical protein
MVSGERRQIFTGGGMGGKSYGFASAGITGSGKPSAFRVVVQASADR